MDIGILHEFLVLAELRNYQNAAYSLAMSQSNLSKHIIKLEEELGVTLFDRTKRSVLLTKNGAILRDYARRICALNDECLDLLQEQTTNLCIGYTGKHGQFGLVETLTWFRKEHPNLKVDILERSSDQLKPLLTAGKCDFIFSAEYHENEKEFYNVLYKTDTLVAVLPNSHPLAKESSVSMDQLRNEAFVVHNTPHELQLFETLCQSIDYAPNVVSTVGYISSIFRLISQGVGVSILSKHCTALTSAFDVTVVDLVPTVSTNIYMLYLKKKRLSPAAQEFIHYIETHRSER